MTKRKNNNEDENPSKYKKYDDEGTDEDFIDDSEDNILKNIINRIMNRKIEEDKLKGSKTFQQIKKYTEENKPTLSDIVHLHDVNISTKSNLYELYCSMDHMDPFSREWRDVCHSIKIYMDTDEEKQLKKNYPKLYSSLRLLRKEIFSQEIDLKHIMESSLKLKDKIKIYSLYKIMMSQEPLSTEWFDLQFKIKREIKNSLTEKVEKEKKYVKEKEDIKKHHFNKSSSLKNSILALNTSLENKAYIYKRYKDYRNYSGKRLEEAPKIKTWLDYAISLPYDNIIQTIYSPKDDMDALFSRIQMEMDKELYGMKKVKEQILIHLNARITNPNMKGNSLALLGEPGTGKTTLSRLLGKILNIPFYQISFGGINNVSYLKGMDYTYIGSHPGEIVTALSTMKYKNGIIFLDEFEKISDKKSITSLLLHITDPSQNSEFKDLYMGDLKIDLSQIWFVYSMNKLPVDVALKDRLFVIDVTGYSFDDKVLIGMNYILPKFLKNVGMNEGDVIMDKEASEFLVNRVCDPKDRGVRDLERALKDIINKINFLRKSNLNVSFSIKNFSIPFKLMPENISIFIKKDIKDAYSCTNMLYT